jgi:hypothetical protein
MEGGGINVNEKSDVNDIIVYFLGLSTLKRRYLSLIMLVVL